MTDRPSDRAIAQAFYEQHRLSLRAGIKAHMGFSDGVFPKAKRIDAAAPDGAQEPADRLRCLIDQYWSLAFAEGKERRNHDTEAGDGQRVSLEIDQAIRDLTGPPSQDAEDAARYRWLRSASLQRSSAEGGIPWPVIVKKEHGVPTLVGCFEHELDAAIDAAISASQE